MTFSDASSRLLHAQIFHTFLLQLRTLGIESGRKGAEIEVEKAEGKRKRRARGSQKRALIKSIKSELIMLFMLKF